MTRIKKLILFKCLNRNNMTTCSCETDSIEIFILSLLLLVGVFTCLRGLYRVTKQLPQCYMLVKYFAGPILVKAKSSVTFWCNSAINATKGFTVPQLTSYIDIIIGKLLISRD